MGKKRSVREVLTAVLFFGGFAVGILFINLWGNTYLKENSIINTENLRLFAKTQIDAQSLFLVLLRKRGSAFLLFWLLGYTAAGIPAIFLLLVSLGFSAGVLSGIFVMRMRMMGLLFFCASVLPQAIFYAPLVWLLAGGILERGVQRFQKGRLPENLQSERPYVRRMLICAALLLAGAVLESSVNPWLLRLAVNYFL